MEGTLRNEFNGPGREHDDDSTPLSAIRKDHLQKQRREDIQKKRIEEDKVTEGLLSAGQQKIASGKKLMDDVLKSVDPTTKKARQYDAEMDGEEEDEEDMFGADHNEMLDFTIESIDSTEVVIKTYESASEEDSLLFLHSTEPTFVILFDPNHVC